MAKILVVDDDPNNRLLLKSILNYDGHTVVEADSGAAGLARVAEDTPDLVIVDLNMPDVDGVTFVRTLRENPAHDAVEIALYTGTMLTAAIGDFLQLYRVRTVIPKPSEPEEVLRLVSDALRGD
ncbi:MAG: response regulator [Candidatus Eremiobacteraeota bacterium]|nr:response regulator [Candidatus Eremiobacteraeota bacterium]